MSDAEMGFAFNPRKDFMTENMAGRGEGLVGLVAQWEEIAEHGTGTPMTDSFQFRCAMERCAAELKLALEAAAPAGTPHITAEMVQQADACWSGYGPGRWSEHLAKVLNNLLATPSPQAGNGMVRRCMARNSETGQCELREGHATKHLAGMLMWGEAIEDATNPVADPEYVRTMEAPAATQEPAGSALLCPRCGCASKDNPFDQRRRLCLTCCAGFDIADAADPGSPRKVGEDGLAKEIAADLEDAGLVEPGLCGIKVMEIIARRLRSSSAPVGEQKQEEGV